MGGDRGVDGNFTCGRADLHIRARSLHVCVHMFTFMDEGFALCVSVCSRVCTQIIHVCVYIFTCTHTGSVCVCMRVYICYMCVCIYLRIHTQSFHV